MTDIALTIQLLHPDPEKQAPRISLRKYTLVKDAILDILPSDGTGFPFKDLANQVASIMNPAELAELGSPGWYITTVKLDLEARNLIERVPRSKPQLLRRTNRI